MCASVRPVGQGEPAIEVPKSGEREGSHPWMIAPGGLATARRCRQNEPLTTTVPDNRRRLRRTSRSGRPVRWWPRATSTVQPLPTAPFEPSTKTRKGWPPFSLCTQPRWGPDVKANALRGVAAPSAHRRRYVAVNPQQSTFRSQARPVARLTGFNLTFYRRTSDDPDAHPPRGSRHHHDEGAANRATRRNRCRPFVVKDLVRIR